MKISVICPTIRPESLKMVYDCLRNQTFQEFEFLVEVSFPERGHDLNASFNKMLRRAKGELIVFYEDYMKIPDNGLQQFWTAYKEFPNTCFTAPVGKTSDWKEIKWDWRAYPEADMAWNRLELDWGAIPLEALKKIGGFDENLDKFWSADNVSVGKRLEQFGYKFARLIDNKAIAFDHDAHSDHPFRKNYNPEYINELLESYKFNPKLPYLD